MVIWLIDLMTRVFVFSFPSGKRSDRVQCTGRFWAHFQATDFAAPMVVTVWSSVDEFQALAMRLAANRQQTLRDYCPNIYCTIRALYKACSWPLEKSGKLSNLPIGLRTHHHASTSLIHTGSFTQNSFQIDWINSCSTSKKLQFWLKIVKIIHFLIIKLIKGKLGFILEITKKNTRWRHKSEISKRNVIILPLGVAWVSKEAVWST